MSRAGAFQCVDCRPGTYSLDGSSSCDTCQEGFYPNASQNACEGCPAGKKRASSDTFCVDCENGEFSNPGSPWCDPCPAGEYNLPDKTACAACPAGRYSFGSVATCSTCAAGEVPDSSQTSCIQCGPGTYSLSGNASCINCPAGRYSDYDGLTECWVCPWGFYSDTVGATDYLACKECSSLSTKGNGSTNISSCIEPVRTHTFECALGKQCRISNFSGSGLLNMHSLAVKESKCIDFYGYGAGTEVIPGFGTDGRSSTGSTSYSWPSTLTAAPGTYLLCWCAGLETLIGPAQCSVAARDYYLDVGQITVVGPYSGQNFSCAPGTSIFLSLKAVCFAWEGQLR